MRSLRSALVTAVALCSGALSIMPAAAMPFAKPTAGWDDAVQNVGFACGPPPCWWGPNYYYAYVIPYTSGPDWYGGWRRTGWHRGRWGRRW